jgi:subtilisin family serine protease
MGIAAACLVAAALAATAAARDGVDRSTASSSISGRVAPDRGSSSIDPGSYPVDPPVAPPPPVEPPPPAVPPPADPVEPNGPGDGRVTKPDPQLRSAVNGRYIVVYTDAVRDAAAQTRVRSNRLGFKPTHVYSDALEGFAAKLTRRQVRRLLADKKVAYVNPDRRVDLANVLVNMTPGDSQPTGTRRTLAATVGPPAKVGRQAGVRVAVLDTGIKQSHPDLNVVAVKNCVAGTSDDLDGHGTHVAGTIAAKNNNYGVTGVAPGTELVSVKVHPGLTGTAYLSNLMCGVNWLYANAAALNIRVANISLQGSPSSSGPCAGDPAYDANLPVPPDQGFHQMICNTTKDKAVTFAVAAGDGPQAFDSAAFPTIPAVYKEVMTTTAMSDTNGHDLTNVGPPMCGQPDDKPASFSNFALTTAGMEHTIAAPGVCIRSTYKTGPWYVMSGTSMAAAHIAGEVALCIKDGTTAGPCSTLTPPQIITRMRNDAADYNAANPNYGFAGDPLHPPNASRYYGFLYRTLPPVTTSCPPNIWMLNLNAGAPLAIGGPFVTWTSPSSQRPKVRLEVNFKPSVAIQCHQAAIYVEYNGTPTGWTVNIGDSPVNRGNGDQSAGTTKACSEAQIVNMTRRAYKDCAPSGSLIGPTPVALNLGGLQRFVIRDHYLSVLSPFQVPSAVDMPRGFHIPDTLGPNPDGYKIYAAFNRVIKDLSRVGTGVTRVWIEMS